MDDEFPPTPDLAELGLPDEFPPIRLPDLATLAQQARASAMLAKAREVAEWLDGREVSVKDHLLSAADIVVALHTLGWSGHEFEFRWDLAAELGFVDLGEDEAIPGPGLDDWPGGPDEMAIEVWDAAFEFVLTDAAWYEEDLDTDTDPELDPVGPTMMFVLFLAGAYGVPRDELSELVRDGLDRSHEDHDAVPGLLERLLELGAVQIDDEDVVRLTPLALSGMRERYVALGIDVPLVPPVEQMTAADLLAAAPALTSDEFGEEAVAWLALREPEQAGQELVGAAAAGDAVERMFAVQLIRSTGLGTEQLWRSAMTLPEVRPYAKTELPGEVPDIAEMAWLLTDSLAATGEIEDFSSAVPAGQEQEIFDAMWRLPHPEAGEVLTMIGAEHPDKKIAKSARKAAFKARS
ncbi:hypothetical protein SK803_45510 [Lentzea sp. BCCO 10_0856]|uniref:Uncharacterized protein n=1 Tax=Lentzea miocenica TaxID=3095431 RepID=A0ABU4TH35_9PSEU|nr:hypothetical protein [Lentzea sp. BCCO 10_0856]MDX8037499.1 hypothetical protein [Lentzea sp. BCCO 10_0856]